MAEALSFHGLRGELKPHEPMRRHVSWRTGGPADRFYVPADLEDLAHFLRQLPPQEPLLFVGLGSNLLVRDGGWRGTVVMTHAAARRPRMEGGLIYAEAGVASPKVARFAALHELEGAEFLAGVPGCVGGALAMNAGCYGGETWDIVERVAAIDRSGTIHERARSEFDIGYRHCLPKGAREEWFAAAWFRLEPGDGETSRGLMKELLARRSATQPLSLPNAGSVFRNPPRERAARLIEACGLKGCGRGAARVSEKHANFIVNPQGAASAADIERLIEHVQRVVYQTKGIVLQTEVRIAGEPA
ncbi:MAG TPA: UDP-N-acetylmuramate dehydrogenase [Burkholderiales bacterium]|nr:UDP-N-acetylmuramate dehydrogenase [Burkholderiales bacterium]